MVNSHINTFPAVIESFDTFSLSDDDGYNGL